MRYTYHITDAQSGHVLVTQKIWPLLKSMLIAGHKMDVTIKPAKRTSEQNALMWALLADVSKNVEWYGKYMSAESWKHVFSAALKKQEAVPGLDGGFVVIGQSTSKMTKSEISDMIELIYSFGAERGVKFGAA